MKHKKLISILLAVVMAFSALYGMGTIVLADSIGFEYDSETATLTVTGTGAMEDYTENTLASRPWSAYAESAQTVVISDGITHVGDYAFSRFSELTYVELHESVTSLGTTAFGGNDSLLEMFVPSTVTEIEPYAFGYAYDMTVPEGFVTYCEYKSAAQEYCFKNYIPFEAPMMGRFEDIAWITEAGQQAVWSFYAYSSGTLEFWSIGSKDTVGLIYDASNYVYSTDYSEMKKSAVAYNDDNGNDVNFKITYTVEAGKRYYLATRFMLQNRYDGSNEYEDGKYGVEMRMTCDEHSLESYVRTFPTCTAPGENVEFCLSCDYENVTEIPMIDHDPYPAVREDIVEATCTDDGKYDMVEYCMLCGGEVSRTNYTVDAYGHDFSEYEYQDNATCTEDGTETSYCSRCGLIDTRTVEGSALGHEFNEYLSDGNATCTEDGTETAHCARCDVTDTRVEQGSAYGHDYEVNIINPTCTDTGYTLHTCLRCGDSYMSDFQDALGHIDGEEEFEIIVDPTCTERGTAHVTVHCTRCGAETFSADRSTDALGHSFTNYVDDNNADCIHNGTETAMCDRCDETDTRTVENSAYGHDYEVSVIAPTCTDTGYTLHTCLRCGDSYMSDFQDALGHIDGEEEFEIIVDPTCTEMGTAHVTVHCTVCGAETFSADRNIDMLGHDFGEFIDDGNATCTTDGTETARCTRCGEVDTRTVEGSALGHEFGEYTNDGNTTCTEDGTESAYCIRCYVKDTRVIEGSAYGHNYSSYVTPATCTEQGYTTYNCLNCGDSYTADYVDAFGHTPGSEVSSVILQPTCTTNGIREYSNCCVTCGVPLETWTGDIPALGHSYVIKSFDGEQVSTECERCQDVKTYDFMFRYNTEIAENDDWTIIDVNGDGFINAKDYAYLYRMTK